LPINEELENAKLELEECKRINKARVESLEAEVATIHQYTRTIADMKQELSRAKEEIEEGQVKLGQEQLRNGSLEAKVKTLTKDLEAAQFQIAQGAALGDALEKVKADLAQEQERTYNLGIELVAAQEKQNVDLTNQATANQAALVDLDQTKQELDVAQIKLQSHITAAQKLEEALDDSTQRIKTLEREVATSREGEKEKGEALDKALVELERLQAQVQNNQALEDSILEAQRKVKLAQDQLTEEREAFQASKLFQEVSLTSPTSGNDAKSAREMTAELAWVSRRAH